MYQQQQTGLEQPLISWIYKYAYKQYWRVASWYDYEDLIQDGMMIAVKCRNRYTTDDTYFRAKVQLAFCNHITDLSNKKITGKCLNPTRHGIKLTEPIEAKVNEEKFNTLLQSLRGDTAQFLYVLIKQSPLPIRKFLECLSKPENLEALRKPLKKGETRNARLCSLAGLKKEIDLAGMVRAYFSSTQE